ncbi:MAG TPA: BTAD domain-containing putative transcriptional regulator [Gemmatimonadaceae bacterium]|jgi:TolB-like protein/DNA-binding SARP family transcriptional activator/Flp pilus assembly protein TadD
MLRLRTLGGLALLDETGAAVATQRRRVALLALLAVAGKHGLTRDKLVGYLWPESSAEHARHALEQLLYALRRQASDKLFLGSDPICLNPEIVESDLGLFEALLARGAPADAVAQYGGPFLDGFSLRAAEDFERWTESQRARLATDYRRALEKLARAEAEQGNYQREIEWRRRIVMLDPLGTQGALDLMRAFAAAGDRGGALQHARVYEALVRAELSSAPDSAITELAQQLQGGGRPTADRADAVSILQPKLPDPPSVVASIRTNATPSSIALTRKMLAACGLALVLAGATAAVLARERNAHPTPARSVAVLPCANLSSNKDDEYFSDGMTDELITALGKIRELRVPARTSAFVFKGRNVPARQIGQELHVSSLVECTVMRGGGRLRITARLIDAADGYQLWSQEYERDVGDVLAVQDEISRAVARALQVTLAAGNDTLPVRRLTTSQEVRDLYLQGRSFFGLRTDEKSLRNSVEYFKRAVQLDSLYAPAYSGLSDAQSLLSIWGFDPPSEGFARAKEAALRALALNDALAEAHTSLGIVSMFFDLDGEKARRELRRAMELDPRYPSTHLFYAWYLTSHGSGDSAVAEARVARDLDPLSIIVNIRVGTMLLFAGHYPEALTELRTTLELDSTNAMTHAELARVLVLLNHCSDALTEIRYLPASFQNVERGVAGYVDAMCGRRAEAVAMLKNLEDQSKERFVFASRIALLHVALGKGEYDYAFDWLERAITQRDPTSQLLEADPLYSPLRNDPRFHRLLVEAGLEHRR